MATLLLDIPINATQDQNLKTNKFILRKLLVVKCLKSSKSPILFSKFHKMSTFKLDKVHSFLIHERTEILEFNETL